MHNVSTPIPRTTGGGVGESLERSGEHERIVVSNVRATSTHGNSDCLTRGDLEPADHMRRKTPCVRRQERGAIQAEQQSGAVLRPVPVESAYEKAIPGREHVKVQC